MITKKFYHKPTQLAYLLFPSHAGPNDIAAMLFSIEEEIGCPAPDVFEIRRVSEGPYWGFSLLKFKLHPAVPFEQKDWTEIDREIAIHLKPEPYKL